MSEDDLPALIAKRFIERRDVKAIQHRSGAYTPDKSRFTKRDLLAHLEGSRTLGHYLVSPEGMCRLFAYDIDLITSFVARDPQDPERPDYTWTPDGLQETGPREAWSSDDPELRKLRTQLTQELRGVADGLAARVQRMLGIPVAIAYSGFKGLHVYGFTGRVAAADARAAALDVLMTTKVFRPSRGDNFFRHTLKPDIGFPNVEIEIYPKQDNLEGKDLGNLMRLPLGVNRKTGNKCFFLNVGDSNQKVLEEVDALAALQDAA